VVGGNPVLKQSVLGSGRREIAGSKLERDHEAGTA